MSKLRLVFMGTPDFAVPALAGLIEAGHEIVCVYSQPPRPAGRGKKTRPGPVHVFAERSGIPVRTPASLKDKRAQEDYAALGADACVVAAYGLILPKPVLEAPRLGCLNIHASLLPRWRGAAPIERAILAGDGASGVTIMAMDESLDTGAMLLQRQAPIGDATTGGELHDRLAGLGATMIVETLDLLATGAIEPTPQAQDSVTYAKKIERGERRLDWSLPAVVLERTVRAFAPRPGAWFDIDSERIRVLSAAVVEGEGKPGTVLDDRLRIACGGDALRPLLVQRAGKGAMEVDAFLRGFAIEEGVVLSSPSQPLPSAPSPQSSPQWGEGVRADTSTRNPRPLGRGQGEGDH